jgi:hypothetical protein
VSLRLAEILTERTVSVSEWSGMMDKVENLFSGVYVEFLARYPKGLADAQFKPDNRADNDEYLFGSIWDSNTIFQQDFSDFPNYLMPSVIADDLASNEVDICFNAPDAFSLDEVRNMHAFGLCDTGFISFNPADSSVCIIYADGFIAKIANSFDEFILSLHE